MRVKGVLYGRPALIHPIGLVPRTGVFEWRLPARFFTTHLDQWN